MNNLIFKVTWSDEYKLTGPQEVDIDLTEVCDRDDSLGGMIRKYCEVELLSGNYEKQPDGRGIYSFIVAADKAKQLRLALTTAMFNERPQS
jgi:hypothetical protein